MRLQDQENDSANSNSSTYLGKPCRALLSISFSLYFRLEANHGKEFLLLYRKIPEVPWNENLLRPRPYVYHRKEKLINSFFQNNIHLLNSLFLNPYNHHRLVAAPKKVAITRREKKK